MDPVITQGIDYFAGKGNVFDYVLLGLFGVFTVFSILDKFGILNPSVKLLSEILTIVKQQYNVMQSGFLTLPQIEVVKDFMYGRLPSMKISIHQSIMDVFISFHDEQESPDTLEERIKDEMMAIINSLDTQISRLPNVSLVSMTKENKLKTMVTYIPKIAEVIKEEKDYSVASKRITGIVDLIIRNNEF